MDPAELVLCVRDSIAESTARPTQEPVKMARTKHRRLVRGILQLLTLVACIPMSAAAAYYLRYERTYELSISVPEAQRGPLLDRFERTLTLRGLLLKQKYHDHYPENVLVYVFEIRRNTEDQQRRDTLLFVLASDKGLVRFIQSELYLNTEPTPADVVLQMKPDVLEAVVAEIGGKPNLLFDPLGPGGRSP
jgi:hypothetical protein